MKKFFYDWHSQTVNTREAIFTSFAKLKLDALAKTIYASLDKVAEGETTTVAVNTADCTEITFLRLNVHDAILIKALQLRLNKLEEKGKDAPGVLLQMKAIKCIVEGIIGNKVNGASV